LENKSKPRIERVTPDAAIPGGEILIAGSGFAANGDSRPRVMFGEAEGGLLIAGESQLVAQVPEDSAGNLVRVSTGRGDSDPFLIHIGLQIADNLHPVGNPAVDAEGNIYVTFSGQRGQKVPVSLYKVTPAHQIKPFVTEMMNPTGLAVDTAGMLYVSCRNDGTIHRVTPEGRSELWIEGMGIATGLAFDAEGNLFVGDRSGTIFKISPDRQVFVFATLEPSIAAYHLAFSPDGELYVSGPTTSSYDHICRITRQGEIGLFYRGLGRPQGLAFDREGNLYVAASKGGRRGIVRIRPNGAEADVVLSGSGLVGLALLPTRRAILTSSNALFFLDWDVEGLPLPLPR
jgi:sugar lactone lactonase YvrE